jgi:hypothetical protein
MDAITYYFTIAQLWLYPTLAIVMTVLAFHYNGTTIFRWLAVAFWAMVAYFFWLTGQTYNMLPYRLLGIVGVAAGIIMAVVPTIGKHTDIEVQAGDAVDESGQHTDLYLQRLMARENRIRSIRRLGRKKVALKTGSAIYDDNLN